MQVSCNENEWCSPNINNTQSNCPEIDKGTIEQTAIYISSKQTGSDGEDNSVSAEESSLPQSGPHSRNASVKRWMKLRTTVQLSSAISNMKSKPPLKREDSFLKRFSTRQIPEVQETVDTIDDSEGENGTTNGTSVAYKRLCCRRKRKKLRRSPLTIVNPDGNFYYYWLMLLSVCVLYNLWTLIVRQTFPDLEEMCKEYWMAADIFTDIIFLFDVIVQFRTGYLEQGLMVYDSCKLADHYIKSKAFLLDIGSLFPLNLLQLNIGMKLILGLPKFLKVYRVYHYYYIVESRTVYPNVLRVGNLIHILLILAHWYGCFYFMLSEAEYFKGAWVYQYRPGENITLSRKYLGSLYWSTLTLTTIGDLPSPETNADIETDGNPNLSRRGHKSRLLQIHSDVGYIFTIIGYLTGVFILATIVGQVGNVITNRNTNRLEFERLLDNAKTYMHHHKVPESMKRRVLRWYDYSWSRGRIQSGGDINSALRVLPDKLKTELALHVNLSVLKKVTIFQECQPEFLHDLVLKMKAYIFTPGDLICRKGEIAREMFIIADGILEVISQTGRVLTTMRAGDFFGEIGILNLDGLNKRTADVRSVGYSELFSLSREDVMAAMKDYPEAQEILQSLGRKRLKEAQNINTAWRNNAQVNQQRDKNKIQIGEFNEITGESSAKGIVKRIKLDVIGLKKVLKRAGQSVRADSECVELKPLTKGINESNEPNKGVLVRMARIYDESIKDEVTPPSSPPKIGAGLPLLQRLKLLKEKQEAEQIDQEQKQQIIRQQQLSEKISDKKPEPKRSLPILQRLTNNNSKSDQDTTKQTVQKTTCSTTAQVVIYSPSVSNEEQLQNIDENLTAGKFNIPPQKGSKRSKSVLKSKQNQDSENIESIPDKESWKLIKDAVILPNTIEQENENKNVLTGIASSSKEINVFNKIDISTSDLDLTNNEIEIKSLKQKQTNIKSKKKNYRSIDDLSPEFSSLSFVNKLKILNDRQRITELDTIPVKSTSFDSAADRYSEVQMKHNQSATIFEIDNSNKTRPLTFPNTNVTIPTPTLEHYIDAPLSPESNETIERRQLKSILKKVSHQNKNDIQKSEELLKDHDEDKFDIDLNQFINDQTVEGFAARHSKLTKSVTFNNTSMSDSSCTNSFMRQSRSGFFSTSLVNNCTHQKFNTVLSSPIENSEKNISNQALNFSQDHFNRNLIYEPQPSTSRYQNLPSTSSDFNGRIQQQEHQQFAKVFIEPVFKQIIDILVNFSNTMQYQFNQRLRSLELDVHKRDMIIATLQKKIDSLEKEQINIAERARYNPTSTTSDIDDNDIDDEQSALLKTKNGKRPLSASSAQSQNVSRNHTEDACFIDIENRPVEKHE